jgi:RNA polymerase sigma-70 factor (ECF subfamily)
MTSNEDELQKAYRQHRPRLLRLLAARGAGHAAEDLLQELWLRLAASPDLAAACSLGYMMRAADRLMIDLYRSQKQGTAREKAWAAAQPGLADNIAPTPGPDRSIAARQQIALVQQALEEIGERPAALFRRHRIEGISQRALAEQFGVSISTVESDLRRVYARIAEIRRAIDEA